MGDYTIKCLSVQQPWAALILGTFHDLDLPRVKDVENRTWRTEYRGPLLIHASKKVDYGAFQHLFPGAELDGVQWRRGVILGVVDLVDIVSDSSSAWAMEGQWHWVLANPRKFRVQVPHVGRHGLHDVPVSALGVQFPFVESAVSHG